MTYSLLIVKHLLHKHVSAEVLFLLCHLYLVLINIPYNKMSPVSDRLFDSYFQTVM